MSLQSKFPPRPTMTSTPTHTLSVHQHLLDTAVLNHPQRQMALQVMDLLKTHQFDALETLLEPGRAAFEAGTLSDWGLAKAWSHMGLQRTDLLEPAAAWVNAHPNSMAALVFAAQLHCAVAWQARGTATSNRTSEKQFAVMQQHFDAAFPYLHRALALRPQPTCAIAVGIAMTRAGQDDPTHDYMALAKPHLPNSPLLYDRMMWALNPKWGGSVEELKQLHDAAKGWSAAWPETDRSLVASCYEIEMADVASCNGQTDEGIARLKKWLQTSPQDDVAHARLAAQYNYRDQMQQAANHMLQALRIAPSVNRLNQLGDYLQQMGQHERAAACFEEAMCWGSGDAAGSMAQWLSEQLPKATPAQRPALEQRIGQVAQHGQQQYSVETSFVLGSIEFFQRGDEAAKARAYDWWRQAAEWGHRVAMFNVGIAHLDGHNGQPLNKPLGLGYLQQAAACGHLGAHERLGKAYLQGDGTAQDDEQAAYHLEIAADGDNVYAMRDWVTCLWFGRGTAQNRDAAQQVLQRLKTLDRDVHATACSRIRASTSALGFLKEWVKKLGT